MSIFRILGRSVICLTDGKSRRRNVPSLGGRFKRWGHVPRYRDTLLWRAAEELEQAEAEFHRFRAHLVSIHGPEPESTALPGERSLPAAIGGMFDREC